MSKQQNTNAVAASNGGTKQKAWVIIAVCVITAVVIAASLIIALWETPSKSIADTNNPSSSTSSMTIRNGNFQYLQEEAASYPKTAQNWSKYTYREPVGSSHGFTEITATNETVMGVISTDEEEWSKVAADVALYGVNLTNPGKAREDDEDANVYVISNKTDYTASIYSQSFSIPSSASVKISTWIKTVDVTGAGVFLIVKGGSNALEQSTSGVRYWFANKGVEGEGITGTADWTEVDLYVFNQTSSSRTVYFNVGLGNVYSGDTAKGTVYIDNIEFETVTANDYRLRPTDTTAYTIERENVENVTTDLSWTDAAATLTNDEYLALANNLAPFDLEEGKVYSKISNDGSVFAPVSMTSSSFSVKSPSIGTQYHVSFWVRVISDTEPAQVLPRANIYLLDAEGNPISGAEFTNVATSKDLEKDTNNGWAQYHFYVKPSDLGDKEVKLMLTLGDKAGYLEGAPDIPIGTVLATAPVLEEINQSEYNTASSGSNSKKVDLGSAAASITVSNGSFGSVVTNSNVEDGLYQPTGWTPAYAGSAELYRNGQNNVTVPQNVGSVTSGVQLNSSIAPKFDDGNRAVLQITNNVATAFGYLSGNLTIGARTATLISVMVKTEGSAKPYVYLYEATKDGTFMMSYAVSGTETKVDDGLFLQQPAEDGWVRYYFLVLTGDTAKTLRIALFNGAMDATDTATDKLSQGTVYFDQVRQNLIGTYTRDKTADELYTKDDDGNWVLDADLVKEITYTAESGYEDLDEILAKIGEGITNFQKADERFTDVDEPVETTSEEEEPPVNSDTTDTTDWALLISIITSALLVGAMVIVLVVKFIFRQKK